VGADTARLRAVPQCRPGTRVYLSLKSTLERSVPSCADVGHSDPVLARLHGSRTPSLRIRVWTIAQDAEPTRGEPGGWLLPGSGTPNESPIKLALGFPRTLLRAAPVGLFTVFAAKRHYAAQSGRTHALSVASGAPRTVRVYSWGLVAQMYSVETAGAAYP